MIKSELVRAVARKTGMKQSEARRVVAGFLDTVAEELHNGNFVRLLRFGTFTLRQRSERTGRHPRTKEPIRIPARTVPIFRAGKGLKDAVRAS